MQTTRNCRKDQKVGGSEGKVKGGPEVIRMSS